MTQIWKYRIYTITGNDIDMPEGAKILTAQIQEEFICLWAEVDTARPLKTRAIQIFGTGHEMPDGQIRTYIGTVQFSESNLVFHVFELLATEGEKA